MTGLAPSLTERQVITPSEGESVAGEAAAAGNSSALTDRSCAELGSMLPAMWAAYDRAQEGDDHTVAERAYDRITAIEQMVVATTPMTVQDCLAVLILSTSALAVEVGSIENKAARAAIQAIHRNSKGALAALAKAGLFDPARLCGAAYVPGGKL